MMVEERLGGNITYIEVKWELMKSFRYVTQYQNKSESDNLRKDKGVHQGFEIKMCGKYLGES